MTCKGTPVWLQADAPASRACGACTDLPGGPACRSQVAGTPCATPQLAGAAAPVQRVMAALQAVVDPDCGRSIVDLQLVKSLRIEGGEVELTVTFPLHCGPSRLLAESAFQALRRVLPDTDVYVRHAG